MADRIPVYIDQSTQRITELAEDDVIAVKGIDASDSVSAVRFQATRPSSGGGTGSGAGEGVFSGSDLFVNRSWSIQNVVFGGIDIPAADAERPDELPLSADEKSVQYALTVSHETLGRTVEIDKEGVIKANDFADINGNSLIWKGTQAEYDALTPNESTLYFITA